MLQHLSNSEAVVLSTEALEQIQRLPALDHAVGDLEGALAGECPSTAPFANRTQRLSVRTVETHLGRAYSKLGISSREQLRDALRAGGQ